jgi:DNA-directed RNA polymerase specialized sigma24 family protein
MMNTPSNFRFMHTAPQDFCAIFEQDMNLLYSLALLLTADHKLAEQCFVAALDDCLNGAEVFPDRARSWSRRAIVKQAIRAVNPRPDGRRGALEISYEGAGEETDEVRGRLMQLPPFERFVFAMAVLERYSIHESAALLNSGARDVERARIRALQFISGTDRDVQRAPFAGSTSRESALTANIGAA